MILAVVIFTHVILAYVILVYGPYSQQECDRNFMDSGSLCFEK